MLSLLPRLGSSHHSWCNNSRVHSKMRWRPRISHRMAPVKCLWGVEVVVVLPWVLLVLGDWEAREVVRLVLGLVRVLGLEPVLGLVGMSLAEEYLVPLAVP